MTSVVAIAGFCGRVVVYKSSGVAGPAGGSCRQVISAEGAMNASPQLIFRYKTLCWFPHRTEPVGRIRGCG